MEVANRLLGILENVKSFQVVKCQMHHEKVAIGENDIPLYAEQDGILAFNRVNLCDNKHRRWRLGCAHSTVNTNFEHVLKDLEKTLPHFSSQISALRHKFKAVILEIYALDHKVGNLEHDLASKKLSGENSEVSKILESLNKVKAEHSLLMERLSKIRSEIEQCILERLDELKSS